MKSSIWLCGFVVYNGEKPQKSRHFPFTSPSCKGERSYAVVFVLKRQWDPSIFSKNKRLEPFCLGVVVGVGPVGARDIEWGIRGKTKKKCCWPDEHVLQDTPIFKKKKAVY